MFPDYPRVELIRQAARRNQLTGSSRFVDGDGEEVGQQNRVAGSRTHEERLKIYLSSFSMIESR
jgi:hypothetical protein